ncbi:DinB family protein [Lysinibacillus cavernae]|uniref:DinB family protein n=1 Tax=Lysinibacillus cavernae TaxID=2666135 RepID=UPI0012D9FFDB|nr:DinB family protein [Lysinibacillus cavernae]
MNQRQENIFQQLEAYRSELLQVLEHVSEERANIIPIGFYNNIRWNMGHLYLDQYLWIEALTKEKHVELDAFMKWFGFGTSPKHFDEETPTFEELKKYLAQQPAQLKEHYGHRLVEDFTPIEMGMQTIEQVLFRTIFHEGMHLQAILTIHRLLNEAEDQS